MNVALIGYGEVGRILGEDLRAAGHDVAAFDLKLGSAAWVPIRAHALVHGVRLADSHGEAVKAAAPGAAGRTRELDWRADADRILDHLKGPQEPET